MLFILGLGVNDCTAGASQQDTFDCTSNVGAGGTTVGPAEISCDLVDDGFPDCDDGSDEGALYHGICSFSATDDKGVATEAKRIGTLVCYTLRSRCDENSWLKN